MKTTQKCWRCEKILPLSAFHRERRSVSGRVHRCKECASVDAKVYGEANKEKIAASQKIWYQANREKVLAQSKPYRDANKGKISARGKAWYVVNGGRVRARNKANAVEIRAKKKIYYAAHKEENRARGKAYQAANKERVRACSRAYYIAHKEEIAARDKAWGRANPEKVCEQTRRKRARKLGASVGEQPVMTSVVAARDGNKCYLCGKRLKRSVRTVDHVIPLARGGEHSYKNVRLCCQSCNSSKGARLPHEHTRIKNLEALSGTQLQLLTR